MKLTDPLYPLQTITALSAQDVLDSGTTKPVLIFGTDGTAAPLSSYVVKPKGNGRMIGAASMRELLASFVAAQLDILVPDPAIINISDEFIESTRYTPNYPYFVNSRGNNFGSKNIEGLISITEDYDTFRRFSKLLQRILVFDIFICTSDRRYQKPNMSFRNDDIYIYDHELSFSFVFDILPNPDPWSISVADRTAIEGHILYNYFRGKELDCDGFIDSFCELNDEFWIKAKSLIPTDLYDEQFEVIKNNLNSKIQNLSIYRTEIKKVLI